VSGIVVNETDISGAIEVTVQVIGELDRDAAGELRTTLVYVILRRRPARVVVDLQTMTRLDSTMVGALSAAYDAACDLQLTLVLYTANARVSDQLDLAGIPSISVATHSFF
jgi:anti-anti-sigma factor